MLGECVVGTSQWAKYDDSIQLKLDVRYIWLPSLVRELAVKLAVSSLQC